MKKLLRDRRLVERRLGSQIASSVFLKHVFIAIEILFCLVYKYSHLIDLSFHVIYFQLENDIL